MNKFARFVLIGLFTLGVQVLTGCGGSGSGGGGNGKTYTVTFNSNGGSAVISRQVQQGGALPAPSPSPTREEYNFEGWYSDLGRTQKVNFPYNVTGNITLYANWTWIPRYEISTPVQLYNVRNDLKGSYTLMADISLSSYANWEPIGSPTAPFTGKINGNGYKITNLKIDRKTEEAVGLFGHINRGHITNLDLEDVNVAGGRYTGAIAGIMFYGTITNCSSSGNIAAFSLSESTVSIAGGIAGGILTSTISNCFSSGNITAKTSGGIAGFVLGFTEGNSIITDCSSSGNITAELSSGGIAGSVYYGEITNCFSTGDITAEGYSGGIAGNADDSTIMTCSSSGTITAKTFSGGITGMTYYGVIINCFSSGNINAEIMAGGIAGEMLDSTITNCFSLGTIYAKWYSGGIAGRTSNSTITNCSSSGTITAEIYSGGITGVLIGGAITNCSSFGTITAEVYSGGIAGVLFENSAITNSSSFGNITAGTSSGGIVGDMDTSNNTITNCSSSGTIYAKGYSGGIAGRVLNGTIVKNCYSTGNITAEVYSGGITGVLIGGAITECYSAADITGTDSGGITGVAAGSSKITGCAAINKEIYATFFEDIAGAVGRIAAYILDDDDGSPVISNNFALDDMADPGDAKFDTSPYNDNGISRTISQLKERSTYENDLGWKFGNNDDAPWQWPAAGDEYPYPILYWQ